jgi:hypothetical protein
MNDPHDNAQDDAEILKRYPGIGMTPEEADGFLEAVRPAGAPLPAGIRSACSCGNDTFWLVDVQITAVCTACGERTDLNTNAFRLNL